MAAIRGGPGRPRSLAVFDLEDLAQDSSSPSSPTAPADRSPDADRPPRSAKSAELFGRASKSPRRCIRPATHRRARRCRLTSLSSRLRPARPRTLRGPNPSEERRRRGKARRLRASHRTRRPRSDSRLPHLADAIVPARGASPPKGAAIMGSTAWRDDHSSIQNSRPNTPEADEFGGETWSRSAMPIDLDAPVRGLRPDTPGTRRVGVDYGALCSWR